MKDLNIPFLEHNFLGKKIDTLSMIFYTKEEIDEIISNEEIVEIACEIKNNFKE
jgi:hypothetical protein